MNGDSQNVKCEESHGFVGCVWCRILTGINIYIVFYGLSPGIPRGVGPGSFRLYRPMFLGAAGRGLFTVGYFCPRIAAGSGFEGISKMPFLFLFLFNKSLLINILSFLFGCAQGGGESSFHLCEIPIFKERCRFSLHLIMVCNFSQSSQKVTGKLSR